ncbi:ketoacyl-ACP synthase III [Dysgonomonas sp. GY75]|uniref:ketoacyl-ACP synthase III n=1 Tax=Dysgonomonas sp. GY75 TaxID=2780419 RepID=UPI001883971F|nr:ketoacyl-ACP synthase III [Dysgonomonas sp. GY75]MBF0647350.1 ketoacyl-ACP synthase III [Dysgonomonas sp. GY75]
MNAIINSIGIYVPEKPIDNHYFESIIDTTDEWITTRTGISQRFYAAENEYTSDLCIKAVQNLASKYNKDLSDIDFIIVATTSGEQVMPSMASQVQTRLNIPNAGCIDVYAACAGFVYGIILAKGLIAAGTHKKVLVIGAETLSKITDFTDRTSCILFGDGAGAVIVEASGENHIFDALTETDGSHGKDLYLAHQNVPINGEPVIPDRNLHQNGKVVFKWAVSTLVGKIQELTSRNHLKLEDIDWLIPHSANIRILESVCSGLNIPMDKCLESIRNYGNTSAASIPIAWYNGIESGKVKLDDNLLLIGFGGGLTCAGICLQNKIEKK